ncbi:hypothetical protein ASD11_11180 [Aeromicrobium sp. Root495]|uniref:DUF5709 domain-containing protein n=1 Tax=Aeromicrobium sp. Root495 TaxID=1736550 RepID=UPI0006F91DEE|nr:DUF5709 domain-containing protein [Aeromicrobium sp. Root495]KQY60053.1 hypothetical protein ASD11_11180 [Aeromicrobium sp. Root495]RYJ07398.1 MAG: hypothetical protein EON52_01455 [Actinomycetales bacterium]
MTDHPIESDQKQPQDTLVDRGVDDVLDEGYSPAENYGPGEGFGTTIDEEREGETLEQRVAQEEPDVDPYADEELEGNVGDLDDEVGGERAGRLVDPDQGLGEDTEKDLVGDDVGIDGAGASAEEAAIHVIEDE